MTTESQISANQANAKLSTGPVTPEGKAIAALNALKHGLTSKTVLLPGEDPAEYAALHDGMLNDFCPTNATIASLVLELIDIKWRLQRASSYEARIFGSEKPDMKALNNMSLHAARLKRQYSATLKEIHHLQAAVAKERKKLLEEAELLCRADRILKRPSTFDQYGFDFPEEDVWIEFNYRMELKKAKEIVLRAVGHL